ncbi:FecR domain-containing protein [Echinicola sp. CAU 1574]|uniref:FecR domain-containing protein n=1 Tax=Echinicola arenosa TaxID=2774144 RepID=A0ABR9AFX7_9BACT|nr:FecR family protein [Echinicola arenosa]MBD8487752.1 FecR domain-containing protein [Echinicola arenosa]
MKSINHLFDISKVLAKSKLKGEDALEPNELKILHAWRDKSDMNQHLVSKLEKESWEDIQAHAKTGLDKEKAWQKIEKSIRPNKSISFLMTLKWAAIIIIPLSLGVILYSQYYVGNETGSLMPGGNGAMLTLSDGSQINLEEKDDLQIEEKSGEKLMLVQDELIYQNEGEGADKEIFNTIETRVGNEYKLRLSDGTKVFLNAQSKLVFPVAFSDKSRTVKLEGEGYFEVSHDQERPFYVEVEGMKVQVLGTSFNVKAYANEATTETVLVEGKVKLINESLVETTLSPDEIGVLNKLSKEIEVSEIDASRATAWVDGKYYFNNARLEDIMKDLARWYDFEAKYSSQGLKEVRFEGWINRYEELDPILEIMEITNKIKIERNGKKLIIS